MSRILNPSKDRFFSSSSFLFTLLVVLVVQHLDKSTNVVYYFIDGVEMKVFMHIEN